MLGLVLHRKHGEPGAEEQRLVCDGIQAPTRTMQLQAFPSVDMSLSAIHASSGEGKSVLSQISILKPSKIKQAATSFECDGCNHHASFHSLENEAEDVILKKWSAQEAENDAQSASGASKKRRRIVDKASETLEILELPDDDDIPEALGTSHRKRNAKQSQLSRSGSTRNAQPAVK